MGLINFVVSVTIFILIYYFINFPNFVNFPNFINFDNFDNFINFVNFINHLQRYEKCGIRQRLFEKMCCALQCCS